MPVADSPAKLAYDEIPIRHDALQDIDHSQTDPGEGGLPRGVLLVLDPGHDPCDDGRGALDQRLILHRHHHGRRCRCRESENRQEPHQQRQPHLSPSHDSPPCRAITRSPIPLQVGSISAPLPLCPKDLRMLTDGNRFAKQEARAHLSPAIGSTDTRQTAAAPPRLDGHRTLRLHPPRTGSKIASAVCFRRPDQSSTAAGGDEEEALCAYAP